MTGVGGDETVQGVIGLQGGRISEANSEIGNSGMGGRSTRGCCCCCLFSFSVFCSCWLYTLDDGRAISPSLLSFSALCSGRMDVAANASAREVCVCCCGGLEREECGRAVCSTVTLMGLERLIKVFAVRA